MNIMSERLDTLTRHTREGREVQESLELLREPLKGKVSPLRRSSSLNVDSPTSEWASTFHRGSPEYERCSFTGQQTSGLVDLPPRRRSPTRMTQLPYLDVGSCIPCTTPEQKNLLQQAKKLVSDRGKEVLSEELSRPVVDIPSELLPYIFLALQEFEEHPLTLETIDVPGQLRFTNSISDVSSKLKLPSLRSNVSAIDKILGNGLPVGSGSIFELSGKAGAGKTQIGIQFALMSPAPVTRGGLGIPSLYVCTEGRPPIRRMEEIDLAMTGKFGLPPRSLLERVITEKILSSDDLLRFAEHRLPHLLRSTGARLVVIDSIAAVYRPEFSDPLSRADHLVKMASALRRAMTAVKGVCFCINQVSQALDGFNSLNATVPALGPVWSNCVSTRLFLSRAREPRERRFIRVTHSSCLPTTDGPGNALLITGNGAVDEHSHNE